MPKTELSPRQRDVLDFIRSALNQRGYPPTYREIGDALGISSTNGVADHVKALVRKGFLEKSGGGAARGLKLTRNRCASSGSWTPARRRFEGTSNQPAPRRRRRKAASARRRTG